MIEMSEMTPKVVKWEEICENPYIINVNTMNDMEIGFELRSSGNKLNVLLMKSLIQRCYKARENLKNEIYKYEGKIEKIEKRLRALETTNKLEIQDENIKELKRISGDKAREYYQKIDACKDRIQLRDRHIAYCKLLKYELQIIE